MMNRTRTPDIADADRDATPDEGAEALKALGNEKRLRIMRLIAQNPGICSCKVLEQFDMSQSTLSHHMQLLCSTGLVECRKDGKWARYTISRDGLDKVIAYLERLA